MVGTPGMKGSCGADEGEEGGPGNTKHGGEEERITPARRRARMISKTAM